MRVHKYIPDKLYGFCIDPGTLQQVFFHLGAFQPGNFPNTESCSRCPVERCSWVSSPAPPILGEEVEIILPNEGVHLGERRIRAQSVRRLHPPKAVSGKVDMFDPQRGFGFVHGVDGVSYHLHKSEIQDHRIPTQGQIVLFYAGVRETKPRACHVRICG